MTDQELIELLRRMSPRLDMLDCENVLTAADRLEEVVKEIEILHKEVRLLEIGFDASQAKLTKALDEREQALNSCEQTLDERDEALAKLTKAVEALRNMLDKPRDADQSYAGLCSEVMWEIRTALAELEGM